MSDQERASRMEARLGVLELRLVSHAEELKSQITDRISRIQSRIEGALHPFDLELGRQASEVKADNVVSFLSNTESAAEAVPYGLHAQNAREAMLELNETLRVTKEHLEALSGSIEKMRQSVESK